MFLYKLHAQSDFLLDYQRNKYIHLKNPTHLQDKVNLTLAPCQYKQFETDYIHQV